MLDAVERVLPLSATHIRRRIQAAARIPVRALVLDVSEVGDQENIAGTGLIEHREVRFHDSGQTSVLRRRVPSLAASPALRGTAACQRAGFRAGFDSSIRRETEVANDFATFFALYPRVTRVFFNGGAAEAAFKRHCGALLGDPRLRFQRLPSTSPAHASLRFEQKLAAWRTVIV